MRLLWDPAVSRTVKKKGGKDKDLKNKTDPTWKKVLNNEAKGQRCEGRQPSEVRPVVGGGVVSSCHAQMATPMSRNAARNDDGQGFLLIRYHLFTTTKKGEEALVSDDSKHK